MNILALVLVFFSATIHAGFNLMAKKALDGNTFIWLISIFVLLIYAPLALYVIFVLNPNIGNPEIIALLGATIFNLIFFICIQAAYKVGDYSIVYPVARGSGPLLATIGAVALMGEAPSLLACTGVLLIVAGVIVISSGINLFAEGKKPIYYGILTGFSIAAYTLWCKYAVADVRVHPVLLDYIGTSGIGLLLLPYVWKNRDKVVTEWKENRANVIGVSILCPLANLIILYVLTTEPVYFVAPLREMSILIAAFLGAKFLKEGDTKRRSLAAVIMFCGVLALSFG